MNMEKVTRVIDPPLPGEIVSHNVWYNGNVVLGNSGEGIRTIPWVERKPLLILRRESEEQFFEGAGLRWRTIL